MWFGLFRFRSPLLTESRLLSLPVGTEMFHFPTFPPHALCVQAWVTGHDSSRVSPFGDPRITAWLPASRGLSQAPTSFIGSWCQGIHRAPLLTWPQRCLFRVHCAVLKLRAVDLSFAVACSCAQCRSTRRVPHGKQTDSPLPQDSTACLGRRPGRPSDPAANGRTGTGVSSGCPTGQCSTHERPPEGRTPSAWLWAAGTRTHGQVLLRKEVIQPHLPVRLPCYDFVPIADPTFDGSLRAVGPPASGVTDFRDVTGGVYKARERIHRSVADLRLLATPTSWGRVADPNPN